MKDKKNTTKKVTNRFLFLLLGMVMGFYVGCSKQDDSEKRINDEYNEMFKKVSSLPISDQNDAISTILEDQFGVTISEEVAEILDDKDIVQRIFEIADSSEDCTHELVTLVEQMEGNASKLVMQRIRESGEFFEGSKLTIDASKSKDDQFDLWVDDTCYDLGDGNLEQVVIDIQKLRNYKQENGYVWIINSDEVTKREFIDDCLTVAYDMLQLCVTDVEVQNNFVEKDSVVLKVKK